MSYLERLQKNILLTSPSGFEFTALWSGDSRSNEKQLGIFKTPGVRGVLSQDLDVNGDAYNTGVWFSGEDYDRTGEQFFNALRERGVWSVVHPVWGTKENMQVVSYTQPLELATGVIQTTIEFLQVLDKNGATSSQQVAAETVSQNIALQETTSDQLNQVVDQTTADQTAKLRTMAENTVAAFSTTLENITSQVAEVQAQADSIKRGIDSTIGETPIDVLSLAGQIQALVNLPGQVEVNLKSRIETYQRFADTIFESSPDSPTDANINTAAIQELANVAAIGAVAVGAVTTQLKSRQSVIDNVEASLDLFESVVDGLDATQALYDGQLLSDSYFSQSQSFADTALISALSLAFLIKSAFDLAIEKRITLTEPQNPVMVAMREYQGPGENDENIDLFIDSNELTRNEVLLLPAGKEVVVYV
jgi:prophage DNA circulation protein